MSTTLQSPYHKIVIYAIIKDEINLAVRFPIGKIFILPCNMKADESKKEQYIQQFQLSKLLEKSKAFSAAYLAYHSPFHDT